MADGRFVAYFRVSTARQGQSGLGLDAQRRAVSDWLNGGDHEVVGEFVEVESGKRSDRPELARAIAEAKRLKATLVIAKLDRLARNVHFISGLMESGVEFVACDMPAANRFTLHILAAVAEHEAAMISQRTKAALASAKARGQQLGFANERNKSRVRKASQAGGKVLRTRANLHASNILPIVEAIKTAGVTTLGGIANALNARGVRTARGGRWHPTTVKNLLSRKE